MNGTLFKTPALPLKTGKLDRLPMTEVPAPREATVFLRQHSGEVCIPAVEVGDRVLMGQALGTAQDQQGADVHSPVSGEVTLITAQEDPYGGFTLAVTIVSDGKDEAAEPMEPMADFNNTPPTRMLERLRQAGVTTYNLEPLPLSAAIRPADTASGLPAGVPEDTPEPPELDTVIINTVDEEPLTVVNQRLFIDHKDRAADGIALIKRLTRASRVIFTVRREHEKIAVKTLGNDSGAEIKVVPVTYPATLPRMMVESLTSRAVPSGGTARDAGVLHISFEIMLDALDAITKGAPNMYEMLTVSGGAVNPPKNLKVRIGTPLRDVLRFADCREAGIEKLILGGPMRGKAQFSLDMPVVKGINTILALTSNEVVEIKETACINCGDCVDICPVKLQPNLMSRFCEFFQYDDPQFQKELRACIECGLCGYVCPSHRPMMQYFLNAKHQLGF